jgi:threonine dehydratase
LTDSDARAIDPAVLNTQHTLVSSKTSSQPIPIPHQPPPSGSDQPVDITFGDVSMAAYRIRSGIDRTPVYRSRKMSQMLNATVYFKNEFQLPTGSFKERGGRNALLQLGEFVTHVDICEETLPLRLMCADARGRKTGVIAASAGNHALALAYHGQQLGVPVTVVMPRIAPITKVQVGYHRSTH